MRRLASHVDYHLLEGVVAVPAAVLGAERDAVTADDSSHGCSHAAVDSPLEGCFPSSDVSPTEADAFRGGEHPPP